MGAHLALTVPLAIFLNAWTDEFYTLQTTSLGFGRACVRSVLFEMEPPLYFALIAVWRSLGSSVVMARLFSVACVAAALLVVAGLARRYLPSLPPVLVVAIVAFNPFAIWAAVEIRLYGFALLLSSLVLLTFHDGYLARDESLAARRWNALVSAAALYTQYYLGFLLLAQATGLLVLRRPRRLLDYVFWMNVTGLAFAPMLVILPAQISGHAGTIASRAGPRYLARLVAWRVQQYATPSAWLPEGAQWAWFAVFIILMGSLGCLLVAGRRKPAESTLSLWAATVFLAASFFGVLLITGEDLFDLKHTVALFVPSVLAVLGLVASAGSARLVAAWAVLAFASYGGMLAHRYEPMAKEGDAARVAAFIMAREKPGEPILVFNPEGAGPIGLYYKGPNAVVPVPRPMNPEFFDTRLLALHSEAEFWKAAGDVMQHPTVWLVTQGIPRFKGIDFNRELLERLVARHFDVEVTQSLYKARVRRLRLVKPPEGDALAP
jgi:hypothetical protein